MFKFVLQLFFSVLLAVAPYVGASGNERLMATFIESHGRLLQGCKAGTFVGQSKNCAVCPPDTFSSKNSTWCSPCPTGETSEAGSKLCTPSAMGYGVVWGPILIFLSFSMLWCFCMDSVRQLENTPTVLSAIDHRGNEDAGAFPRAEEEEDERGAGAAGVGRDAEEIALPVTQKEDQTSMVDVCRELRDMNDRLKYVGMDAGVKPLLMRASSVELDKDIIHDVRKLLRKNEQGVIALPERVQILLLQFLCAVLETDSSHAEVVVESVKARISSSNPSIRFKVMLIVKKMLSIETHDIDDATRVELIHFICDRVGDEDSRIRYEAVTILGMIEKSPTSACTIQPLSLQVIEAAMLSDFCPRVRLAAVNAIANDIRYETDCCSPVNTVFDALKLVASEDKNESVRNAAREAQTKMRRIECCSRCNWFSDIVTVGWSCATIVITLYSLALSFIFAYELVALGWGKESLVQVRPIPKSQFQFLATTFITSTIVSLIMSIYISVTAMSKKDKWESQMRDRDAEGLPPREDFRSQCCSFSIADGGEGRRRRKQTRGGTQSCDAASVFVCMATLGDPRILVNDCAARVMTGRKFPPKLAVYIYSLVWIPGVVEEVPSALIQAYIAVMTGGGLLSTEVFLAVSTVLDIVVHVLRSLVAFLVLKRFQIIDAHHVKGHKQRELVVRKRPTRTGILGVGVMDQPTVSWLLALLEAKRVFLISFSMIFGVARIATAYVGFALLSTFVTPSSNWSEIPSIASVYAATMLIFLSLIVLCMRAHLMYRTLRFAPMLASDAAQILSHGETSSVCVLSFVLSNSYPLYLLWTPTANVRNQLVFAESVTELLPTILQAGILAFGIKTQVPVYLSIAIFVGIGGLLVLALHQVALIIMILWSTSFYYCHLRRLCLCHFLEDDCVDGPVISEATDPTLLPSPNPENDQVPRYRPPIPT